MKNAFAIIALLIGHYGFAQCPFAVTLKNTGICLGNDTLTVSVNNISLSKIVWYNGSAADTTINAAIDTLASGNGITVAGGNGLGSAADRFKSPVSLCVDGSGNIYIADLFNYRIQKFLP